MDGAMTVPLWGLAIYVVWIVFVVVMLLGARGRHLAAGGDVAAFGIPDDSKLIWRLFRVQANLVENLPLYAAVVLIISIRGVSSGTIDALVIIYMVARIAHSVIHIYGADPRFRLACLLVQLLSLLGLVGLAVL